ncbi:MAG: helix-hairpin-helix domain-containing protein [Myxococcota bacterium]
MSRVPVSEHERRCLRQAGVRQADLAHIEPSELHGVTGMAIALERCEHIVASARLQTLGSVGPSLADDLIRLGIRKVEDLVHRDPRRMWEELNRKTGTRHDPCVEYVFRCAVAQARDPELAADKRQWWSWK